MAHLNCFPARAAGVNFWFFIAVPFGGECWDKAKCEMLLRKIDGEKNVPKEIVDFPRNCEIVTVATCFTTNGSCHGLAPSLFDDMTRHRRQNLAGDDRATLMVN